MQLTVTLPDHLADRVVLASHLLQQRVDDVVAQAVDWWLEDARGPSLLLEKLRDQITAELVHAELDGRAEDVTAAMRELEEAGALRAHVVQTLRESASGSFAQLTARFEELLAEVRARRATWPKDDALTFVRKARREACEAIDALDARLESVRAVDGGHPAIAGLERDRAYFAAQAELMAEAAKLLDSKKGSTP